MKIRTILLPAVALLICGCSESARNAPVTEWQEPLGASYREQLQGQTLYPRSPDDSPVMGLDGKIAERAMTVRQDGDDKKNKDAKPAETFAKPKPPAGSGNAGNSGNAGASGGSSGSQGGAQ